MPRMPYVMHGRSSPTHSVLEMMISSVPSNHLGGRRPQRAVSALHSPGSPAGGSTVALLSHPAEAPS
jgi:hypothetical protein